MAKEYAELSIGQGKDRVTISLERQRDGACLVRTNITDMVIVLPYMRSGDALIFQEPDTTGEFRVRIEAPSSVGLGDLMVALEGAGGSLNRSSALFVTVGELEFGDESEKKNVPHDQICVWAQDGIGNWSQRHLFATERKTSRK